MSKFLGEFDEYWEDDIIDDVKVVDKSVEFSEYFWKVFDKNMNFSEYLNNF